MTANRRCCRLGVIVVCRGLLVRSIAVISLVPWAKRNEGRLRFSAAARIALLVTVVLGGGVYYRRPKSGSGKAARGTKRREGIS